MGEEPATATPAPATAAATSPRSKEDREKDREARTAQRNQLLADELSHTIRVVLAPRDERLATLEGQVRVLMALLGGNSEGARSGEARLDDLEQRLADLNERALKSAGIWRAGATYMIGDCVTHSGSLWKCVAQHVSSGPVLDHSFWQLVLKRGKDGRRA